MSADGVSNKDVLKELSLKFLSNCRLFPWHKAKIYLESISSQRLLYEQTIGHSMATKYPMASAYLQKFVKTWINQVSSGDVLEEVYDFLGTMLSNPTSQIGYRIYTFDDGEQYVATRETMAMCSKGTTGLQTWQACLTLCKWATENKHVFKNRKVLELGCGVGLLGCVISRFCSHITLSDHHESVLSAAQHTLQINCVENGKVVPLDWTTRGPVEEEYDVTIAADVVFDPRVLPHLVQTIKKNLSSPHRKDQVSYICSTVRNKETYGKFLDEIDEQGLVITDLDVSGLKSTYFSGADVVKLIKLELVR